MIDKNKKNSPFKLSQGIRKDKYGLLYSTELLLSIILLVFIIGIIANLSDGLNERIISQEEFSTLERLAVESSDYLLNNPGNPEDWEDDEGLNRGSVKSNIIPGLAIKKKEIANGEFYDESSADERIMSNSISYRKLIKLKENYDILADRNLFNGSFKTSMAIYPSNGKIRPLIMGNNFDEGDANDNDNDIAVAERMVQCDFYSSFVVYEFNDFELLGDDAKESECNHKSNPNLTSHENDWNSVWLCKSFRVFRKSLDSYDYYLISDESVKGSNVYWILESLNRTRDNKERLDKEVIELNPFFAKDMENSSGEIYSIHFNLPKNRIEDFKTVLVAIPKNMSKDMIGREELKYDYFKSQEVKYVLKIVYK